MTYQSPVCPFKKGDKVRLKNEAWTGLGDPCGIVYFVSRYEGTSMQTVIVDGLYKVNWKDLELA